MLKSIEKKLHLKHKDLLPNNKKMDILDGLTLDANQENSYFR